MEESLLRGLFDGCSQEERHMTMRYFEHLQNTPSAWKSAMRHFNESNKCDERVLFFCLQVLEHHVKTRHATSSEGDVIHLRETVISWFDGSSSVHGFKPFVKNKMAQIIALTFIIDYPLKWPQFFDSVLCLLGGQDSALNSTHPSTIDMYLRTLLAIDNEIVDREVIHSQEENARNTIIKDQMRDSCVPQLVESWFQILSCTAAAADTELLCQTMIVLGCYVSWIDITLVANDRFVGLLLRYLSVIALRESAATCLRDIVNKGMEPISKLELINSLVTLLETNGILNTQNVDTDEENVEFRVKMADLVNSIGTSLILCYQKFVKGDNESHALLSLVSVRHNIPYLLSYLTDEDDGVSENVLGFATQFLSVLKHLAYVSDEDKETLQALLSAVVFKLRYDESYNFLNPGEEEALFMEFRGKLRTLFENISQVDPSLVLNASQSLISQCLSDFDHQSFPDIEVSLLLFHYISEHNFEKLFGSSSLVGSPFHTIMIQILDSNLSHYPHTAVLLQYYEAILRHERFFSSSPQFIPRVVESLLDGRGLRHINPSVCSRVCFQFLRFIKATRSHIGDMAVEILKSVEVLLKENLESTGSQASVSPNDVLFLYEAAGYLVVHSSQSPQGKCELMRGLLAPLLTKFNYCLTQLCVAGTPQEQDHISQLLYYLLSYTSRTSKVFPNHQMTSQSGCLPCYIEALPLVLQGLQVTVCKERVQSGVRQYIHRMIICLGDELLKSIPLIVSLLLKDAESHDIQEFIPLINQLITKYKSRISPFLSEVFGPIVQKIAQCINKEYDPEDTDEHRDRVNLHKSYYLFINSICINGVTEVLACQEMEQVNNVLSSLVEGAKNSLDPSVKRICFMSLKKLVEGWGGQKIVAVPNAVDGFVDYVYKEVVPICFIVPLQASFDLNEGQTYLCLGEIVALLKELVSQRGEEFLLYLQSQYLPSLTVPPDITREMSVRLQENDMKSLKVYFKALFTSLRTLPSQRT